MVFECRAFFLNLCSTVVTLEEVLSRLSIVEAEVVSLRAERLVLLAKIDILEKRLSLDSYNSSKPPSTDGPFKKVVKSLRVKTGKAVGGQKGHEGRRLEPVSEPDHVEEHCQTVCLNCGESLSGAPLAVACHQVFDVPRVRVTEHRAHTHLCPGCGHLHRGEFPADAAQPTQYGPGITSTILYWRVFQLIPVGRIAAMAHSMWGIRISAGTVLNMSGRLYSSLSGFEDRAKELLQSTKMLHSDETGARTGGGTSWMHVYSTVLVTLYFLHPNRGVKAMGDIGILSQYAGTVVHDRYRSYFLYSFSHAVCNAHILRDLIYLKEEEGCAWAQSMIDLLVDAHRRKQDGGLDGADAARVKEAYMSITRSAIDALPPPGARRKPGQRGAVTKTREHNLLLSRQELADSILRFTTHSEVPFDNNQAERDLRMIKLLIKVSGCFRTFEAGTVFARNRAYISTLQKNGQDILEGITLALQGNAFMPKAA